MRSLNPEEGAGNLDQGAKILNLTKIEWVNNGRNYIVIQELCLFQGNNFVIRLAT